MNGKTVGRMEPALFDLAPPNPSRYCNVESCNRHWLHTINKFTGQAINLCDPHHRELKAIQAKFLAK